MVLLAGSEDCLTARVRSAIDRAARFTVDMQAKSGAWADFNLEVGLSDAWTTGYIGAHLLEVQEDVSARERRYLRRALDRAAEFLESTRRSDGTWGYNASVPPDCDSTSWAALFLTATGRRPGRRTYRALRAFARADGGFATYNPGQSSDPAAAPWAASSSWTWSHPDVTPVAARALAASSALEAQTFNFIVANRDGAGLWNSYWYRTPLYATLHNLIALSETGQTFKPPAAAVVAATAAHDPFELALALEIVSRFAPGEAPVFVRDAVATLLATQSPEGWWAARPMLRVTHPSIGRPWELPGDTAGAVFSDDYFTFTTATVARALCRVGRERRSSEGAR